MKYKYQCNVNINTNRFLILPRQMVFKSFVDSRHNHSSGNLERHKEPEEKGNNLKANQRNTWAGRTHRHPGPGQTSPGHSGPGHPGPRTSRSPDIQVPGHPGLSDIQVFRTSRSQDIQVPGHPSLLDIQVPGHPGLSDFQVLSLIVKMFIRSCFLINLLKCLIGHKSLGSLFVCQK